MNPDTDPPSRRRAAPPARRDVQIQNPCRYREAAARRLRPWLEDVLAEVAPRATSFAVRFTSDREMRRWNREYRGKDRPTDVLSFPGDLDDGADGGAAERHLGDVVVAVPTARRQAAEHGHDAERELRLLLLHGVLHCLGHDHETDGGVMERLERRLRRRFVPGARR